MATGSNGGKDAYKKRGLSKRNRFSAKKINTPLIVVLLCVVATFIFAIILGNILGDKAHSVTTPTTPEGPSSDLDLPSVDKVLPKEELKAFYVDLAGIDPDVESLFPFTDDAREKGNALFLELKDYNGKLIYTSETTENLDISTHFLKISRIEGHFAYYADYAVGYYKTDFSASQSAEKRAKTQYNDTLILQEITSKACDEIVIVFENEMEKSDLIFYQTYLLNIKLALPEIPVGIEFSREMLTNSDLSGVVASLLEYADYYIVDMTDLDAQQMTDFLSETVYYFTKYKGIAIISSEEETLEERITALENKKIYNYIVK